MTAGPSTLRCPLRREDFLSLPPWAENVLIRSQAGRELCQYLLRFGADPDEPSVSPPGIFVPSRRVNPHVAGRVYVAHAQQARLLRPASRQQLEPDQSAARALASRGSWRLQYPPRPACVPRSLGGRSARPQTLDDEESVPSSGRYEPFLDPPTSKYDGCGSLVGSRPFGSSRGVRSYAGGLLSNGPAQSPWTACAGTCLSAEWPSSRNGHTLLCRTHNKPSRDRRTGRGVRRPSGRSVRAGRVDGLGLPIRR